MQNNRKWKSQRTTTCISNSGLSAKLELYFTKNKYIANRKVVAKNPLLLIHNPLAQIENENENIFNTNFSDFNFWL